MTPLPDIEIRLDALTRATDAAAAANLLSLGEQILSHWVVARGMTPTEDKKEGFRLLALHRQGARGEPSFNACRETCRELVYQYNLITSQPDHPETVRRVRLAALVAKHLFLFVTGKMEVAGLGEFCCSSRPLRTSNDAAEILDQPDA